MDFLNQAVRQLSDLFRSMSPASRITTALLLVAIATSLVYLFRFQVERTDEYPFGGIVLTQSDVIAIEAALGKHGLNNYDISGNRLRVPRSQKNLYLAALAEENALPQSVDTPWLTMFEMDSPFDPRDTRDRKAKFAEEKTLSLMIGKLNDIENAYVKIHETPAAGFGSVKKRGALVVVKPIGSKTIDESQVAMIRHSIGSAAGIEPENVTVADTSGTIHPAIGNGQGADAFHNVYANYQRQFAALYKGQILNRLSAYPGIKVEVNVELDKDLHNQTSTFKYDEKPTPLQSSTLTKESSTTTGDKSGRPGAVPNGAVGLTPTQVAATSANESTTNESREEQKNVVGATQTTTNKAPLSPVYVSASIGVPTSYFVKLWHLKNPTQPGEDPKSPPPDQLKQIEAEKIKEIEEAVVGLLPRPPKGDDQYKPVKVVPFDETPLPEPEPPTMASTTVGWFAQNWQTVGLFALAAFGVIFLRGMVRSANTALPPSPDHRADRATQAAAIEAQEESVVSSESNESQSNTLKRRFNAGGRSLRDELTELVREDPDAAANVLKLWISDAA